MGGLAIHIPDSLPECRRFLPGHINATPIIKTDGLRFLVKQESDSGAILGLLQEEIRSKSKANGLAKTLACIQAVWFIAQCITRRTYLDDFRIYVSASR